MILIVMPTQLEARPALLDPCRALPAVCLHQPLDVSEAIAFGNLRKFLGLIASAYSSGARRQQGSITQAGNPHARRAFGEGAWAYRSPATVSRHRPLRREKHPKRIQDISWKAQVRLCKRYRSLVARGKHAHVVTVAMARALVGFMWAMAKQLPVTASVQRTARHCTLTAEGLPTGIGRDTAPVWCHPRRREEAGRGHASLDRGRYPTEARKVGANPRRAAGSTVVSSWLRLF